MASRCDQWSVREQDTQRTAATNRRKRQEVAECLLGSDRKLVFTVPDLISQFLTVFRFPLPPVRPSSESHPLDTCPQGLVCHQVAVWGESPNQKHRHFSSSGESAAHFRSAERKPCLAPSPCLSGTTTAGAAKMVGSRERLKSVTASLNINAPTAPKTSRPSAHRHLITRWLARSRKDVTLWTAMSFLKRIALGPVQKRLPARPLGHRQIFLMLSLAVGLPSPFEQLKSQKSRRLLKPLRLRKTLLKLISTSDLHFQPID